MNRLKYFVICTLLCLAYPLGDFLLEGWGHVIDYITSYYAPHLFYFIGTILFLVLGRRLRILYLLFLITVTDIQLIFLTNGVFIYEIEGLKPFLLITSIAGITIIGYFRCKEFTSRQSILLSVLLGILSSFAILFTIGMQWDIFIQSYSWSFSELLNAFVGLFIGGIFCFLKTKENFVKVGILSSILCIVSSLYLSRITYNWLCYDSFTGKTQQKVSFSFYNDKKESLVPRNLKKQYQVFFLWEYSDNSKQNELQNFEKLYWSESQRNNLCFYIIASDTTKAENPFHLHNDLGLQIPIFLDKNPVATRKQLHAHKGLVYVGILKGDTLIYKNNLDEASKFIRHLNKQL